MPFDDESNYTRPWALGPSDVWNLDQTICMFLADALNQALDDDQMNVVVENRDTVIYYISVLDEYGELGEDSGTIGHLDEALEWVFTNLRRLWS